MPNYCYYTMKVKGEKENLDKFNNAMQSDYHYEHIERDYQSLKEQYGTEVNGDPDEYIKSSNKIISYPRRIKYVNSNIDQGPHLFRNFECERHDQYDPNQDYYNGYCAWSVASCMFSHGMSYYDDMKNCTADFHGTTIDQLAKDLNVDIEIYSEECGMGFQEHYIVDSKGEMLEDECVEYNENWDEETDEYHPEGGFENWGDFSI